MRRQTKTLLVMVILLLLVINIAVGQTAAQQQVGDNLLTNPGFESGHYNQDNIPQIAVPNGWRMHWVDGVTFSGAWDNLPAYRPETVVWNSQGGVPEGEEILWRDGIYNLKIFKSWAPMWAALSQDVTGLQVGRQYRLVAPVFVDVVKGYDSGQKQRPDNPEDGQVRLGAGATGAAWRSGDINYSGWWSGASIPNFYLNYNVYVHDFTATSENMTVWIEMRSKYPHPNNGFFTDGIGLYALDTFDNTAAPVAVATVDPNLPTSTPLPTATPRADGAVIHVVQAGDSFWNIAIQYASTLGVPPEEALSIIQEANNSPAFITVGQELIILPPQQQAPEPAAELPEATATTESEGATESEDSGADVGLSTTSTEGEIQPLATPEAVAAAPEGGGTTAEQPTMGTVCVSAFDDNSGDGRHDSSESLLAGAALTLSRAGTTVSTYLSDGSTEMHCFEELEPDTYQIRFFPPADYRPTTQDNGWIAVAAGATMPVSFGAQFDPVATTGGQEVAAADTSATTADAAALPAEAALAETPADTGFFANNIGTIILGVVALLVILAGVGVVMLRRG